MPIDTLPDEVLLVTFDFFVDEDAKNKKEVEAWQSLVHVCRRWRSVVFGSPCRLNLRLVCGANTPVRDTLDVWPPLPLVISGSAYQTNSEDNIIAVLERSDRVCQIDLRGSSFSPMEDVMAAMQQPFPELTDLVIKTPFGTATDLPDSFLGGSSPRLRRLKLYGVPFPGLPKLLLSTTHLVDLHLCYIPQSGYISPEVMATALSTLTSLRSLDLKYLFFRSRPDPASQPPPTRSLLPVLETLSFEGVTEYLDDFVARIDAPRLNGLCVAFFDQFVSDTPQFTQLISRTSAFEVLETAHVAFEVDGAVVKLSSETSGFARLSVKISCGELHDQLSSLEQVLTLCLPPVSTAASEDLYIYENIHPDWPDYIEDTLLGLLRPFTAVKNLYLCKDIAPRIALALQGLVGDRTTEVLPALENFFLEGLQPQGPMQKGIRMFIAARQLSDHPVAVFPLSERERYMEMRNLDLEFDE
jgi:F-box-like